MMASGEASRCMTAEVVEFEVTPQEITRGVAEELTVRVSLREPMADAIQVEFLTQEGVEVQVLLTLPYESSNFDGDGIYEATMLNPFGNGIAAGSVALRVVRGADWNCFADSPATISFTLK